MDAPTRKHDIETRVQEKALVRRFSIAGEVVATSQRECLIVDRSRDTLSLVSHEPLAVGERVDIVFDLDGPEGGKTISGIPRNLAAADGSSGYLVQIEIINDSKAAAWLRQFH